jgi:CubicO group peptidase (beta-lactamase class C family)
MKTIFRKQLTRSIAGISLICAVASLPAAENSNGLAPEVTDLNAADVSYQLEQKLPYLEKPFISTAPPDREDGIPVGRLGKDGGKKASILKIAREIGKASKDGKVGNTDSLLISYRGKLLFESYYRRGRINYPHYQMSITKSYTAMGVGRAIQLGHLSMADLKKPVITFLKKLQTESLVKGADKITLHQAMHMSSGIRVQPDKVKLLRKSPERLRGQGQIQAYLQHSDPIPPAPRKFKYQASDPALAMQVIEAVVPGTAEDFIREELLGRLGINNYGWQADTSGLPKSAAGSSFLSRDMLKMGMLVLNKGKWQGKQLIPADYIKRATSPITLSYGKSFYGYFWWVEDFEVAGKTYHCMQGRGAGGQFIFMFPELDLIAVVTAHNKGMGTMLRSLPQKLIPAFVPRSEAQP